jgi:iron(III) transport system substrate-binding protein
MELKSYLLNVLVLIGITSAAGSSHAQAPQNQGMQSSEWAQLVENANKEGKLILFGQANNTFRNKLIAGFNKQYPKIKVEYRSGTKAADLVSKISSEKRAGVHEMDLLLWGANTVYAHLIPAGYISPIKDVLTLPDFSDPSKWVQGKVEYADNAQKYMPAYAQFQGMQLVVNTKLVDVSRLKSYDDLFDSKFAGKIVVGHPRDVGQARYAFGFFYDYSGEDYFKKLAAQKPAVVKDVKQLIEWVAHGKYAIGISPGNIDAVKEYSDAGVPIVGMQLKEGGYYSPGYNNLALVKDAPHPNAAKLFANWIFTKNGQEIIVDALGGGNSVRTDVTSPFKFEEGKKYFAAHLEKNEEIQNKAIETFNKYFPQ